MNNYGGSKSLAVVNIGLIQLRQYDRLSAASRDELILEHFKRLFHKASHNYGSKIDLVCLPELWYTKIVRDFEREFKVILNVAREYDFTVIPGAFKERFPTTLTFHVSCYPSGSVHKKVIQNPFIWHSKKEV
jgi:hypothetical protein